jgi:RNA polymerase sigma-70 factor, ECF subfamily
MPTDQQRQPLHLVVPGSPAREVREATEVELSHALIAGEAWAPSAAWNRYAPMVYGIASRALGRGSGARDVSQDAEDVTQEVFYRLFMKVGTLRQPEALRSFVISFALRIVKWELRKRRTRRWLLLLDSDTLPDVPTPGADAEGRHALEKFYAVLDRLGTRERLVFSLRHIEEMTLDEVAAALGISLSTVKRALDRACKRLEKWLARDPDLAGYFDDGGRFVGRGDQGHGKAGAGTTAGDDGDGV